jgi:hypothetical protein
LSTPLTAEQEKSAREGMLRAEKARQESMAQYERDQFRRSSAKNRTSCQSEEAVSWLTAWAKREPWPTTCLRGPRPITPLPRPLDNVKSRERSYRNPENKNASVSRTSKPQT